MSGVGDTFKRVGEATEDWGIFDPNAPGGAPSGSAFMGDLTGSTAADAAREGGADQVEFSRQALALLREDLDPFKQIGLDQIEGATSLASDPAVQQALRESTPGFSDFQSLSTDSTAQMNFLQNNPLFDSLMEQSSKDIFANQAARGKLGGTGTAELLQNRFLEQGNSLINQQLARSSSAIDTGQNLVNQQLNRQMPLLNMGQSSAAQVGAGSSDLLTGMGDASAASKIAQANAQAAGAQNTASAGMGLLALLSDNRLKSNITKVGEHNGLNVYSWIWNDKAEELGLSGRAQGHIAQELQKTHPHLVGYDEDAGYYFVNYGTDETVDGDTWV